MNECPELDEIDVRTGEAVWAAVEDWHRRLWPRLVVTLDRDHWTGTLPEHTTISEVDAAFLQWRQTNKLAAPRPGEIAQLISRLRSSMSAAEHIAAIRTELATVERPSERLAREHGGTNPDRVGPAPTRRTPRSAA